MSEVAHALADALAMAGDHARRRGLPAFEEAQPLVIAEIGADGREHLLTPRAAAAWRRMQAAARDDGVSLFVASAFRSIARQTEIIRAKLDAGELLDDVLAVCAPPGYSEHHSGCAVDITEGSAPELEEIFAETAAYRWLCARAGEFGFTLSYPRDNRWGFRYEPWHWCFRSGIAASARREP